MQKPNHLFLQDKINEAVDRLCAARAAVTALPEHEDAVAGITYLIADAICRLHEIDAGLVEWRKARRTPKLTVVS
jgi:hypothetical protein